MRFRPFDQSHLNPIGTEENVDRARKAGPWEMFFSRGLIFVPKTGRIP